MSRDSASHTLGSTKATLLALADRCEREPPNRSLDGAIWDALCVECDWRGGNPKRFTTSLDSAVTLVPEGWAWFVERIGAPFTEGRVRLWIPAQRTQKLSVEQVNLEAKTPALALCAAALRARAALAGNDGCEAVISGATTNSGDSA